MQLIAAEFEELSLNSDGIKIDCAWEPRSDGSMHPVPDFYHKPILVGLDADTPAVQWVLNSVKSSQARLSCSKCKCNGCKNATRYLTKGMVFPGYDKPAPAAVVGLGAGTQYQMGVDDESRRLTLEEYEECLDNAWHDRAPDPQRRWGFSGPCPFLEHLPYLDFRYFVRLPTHHALLDFWVNVLRWTPSGETLRRPSNQCHEAISLSKPDVKIVRAAFCKGAFTVTNDFNRSFPGLATMGTWTCEDWLRWAEIYSDFLREEVVGVKLPPGAAEMWPLLQRAIGHYIHGGPDAYDPVNRAEVDAGLLLYAQLAESFHPRMMTSNLHRAICWLPVQEANLGLAAFMGELWGRGH